MRVFCMTCKEPILNTSPDFKVGGPYHGGMFEPLTLDKWAATLPDLRAHTTGGDLHCPRCMGLFITPHGRLLTEHGIILPGQEGLDTSICIMHKDGPAKGELTHIRDSVVPAAVDLVAEAAARRQAAIEAFEAEEELLEMANSTTVDEPAELVKPEPKDDGYPLHCPKCGKGYKLERHFKPHVAGCKK